MKKRTCFFDYHRKLGARLIDFGGWEMPLQYSGIIDEHNTVRNGVGFFDIGHMGQCYITGQDSASFLNWIFTNDINKLSRYHGQYTLMCNDRGGTIDDLYVFKLNEESFFTVLNASRTDTDISWMKDKLESFSVKSVKLELLQSNGALAIQGPKTECLVREIFSGKYFFGINSSDLCSLRKNEFFHIEKNGGIYLISRTGYTGEDGFEIFGPNVFMMELIDLLVQKGAEFGLKPCGLGARDTLRTEAGYPLYGHELNEEISPIEAGLKRFVSFGKGDFIGRSILESQLKNGIEKCCIGFKMLDKQGLPRPGFDINSFGPEPEKIGFVTSGTMSPCLNTGIGLGYVQTAHAAAGTRIYIDIRGKNSAAEIVNKPIFKK